MLKVSRLRAELESERFFARWIFREEVGSTMDIARELAEAGAPEGTIVFAARQTAGRGRRGRGWESPEGGAWFSLLLRPPMELCRAGCLSVLAAVACALAIRERYALPVRVKWPNDLLLDNRKLGGVLIELAAVGAHIDWLIVGIGINVNNPLPKEARLPPLSLAGALGHSIDLEEFFAVILRALARWYLRFLQEGFEPIRTMWAELSALEDGIWVQRGGERFEAQVKGLSELGKLIIERSGRIEELIAEEVTLTLRE